MPTLTAQQLADDLGGRVVGDAGAAVTRPANAAAAGPDDLVFISAPAYVQPWRDGRGRVAVTREDLNLQAGQGRALVLVADPELAMAQVLRHFAPPDPAVPVGVHPTAIVDPSAKLGQGVAIGPWCTVGPGVTLGDGCVLHAGVHVYDHATLGPGCVLWPGS
jgi:UDP-3-O-[3-hydroxymyristoyl] glucosamine N-acyltransferase